MIWVSLRGLAWIALAAALTSCAAPPRDPLAGVYVVKGGGAPLDVFNALSKEFVARHTGVKFEFEDIGSRPGMSLVAGGQIDLATSSAEPEASVRDKVRLVSLGVTGTAIVTGAGNRVSGLTKNQVSAIFSGEIADWADVGGDPGRIYVAMRNANSAIRLSFEAYFFKEKLTYAKGMFEVEDINQTITAVSGRSDVISIITINDQSLTERKIKLLLLDGVAPTKENLRTGAYPVRRPLYLVYNPNTVKPAIKEFVDFSQSPDGQRIGAAAGAI